MLGKTVRTRLRDWKQVYPWETTCGWYFNNEHRIEDDLVQQRRTLPVTVGHDALFWKCQAFSFPSHPCAQSIAHPQTVHGTELQVANGFNMAFLPSKLV